MRIAKRMGLLALVCWALVACETKDSLTDSEVMGDAREETPSINDPEPAPGDNSAVEEPVVLGACVVSEGLDEFVEARMQETQIPGLAVGFVSGAVLLWATGFDGLRGR